MDDNCELSKNDMSTYREEGLKDVVQSAGGDAAAVASIVFRASCM